MELTFLGATETVTGSKYLIRSEGDSFLIDCGLFQGYKALRKRNWEPLPLNPVDLKAVLLTHAHLDHTGYLPLLVKNGFKGPIYSTKATRDLCSILLPDSGYLQEEDARRANKYGYTKYKPAFPLYTKLEAEETLKYFKTIEYDNHYQLSGGLSASWSMAGHILGSSFITLNEADKSILFSGDMGRPNDPVLMNPSKPKNVDYLVLESTYGNRLHDKSSPEQKLGNLIRETAERGGTVVIPSFAVGRAQNILYYLYQLKSNGKIPDIPVYLDSPMAINATKILCSNANEHKLSQEMCSQICGIATYTTTTEESKQINQNPLPKIIISASGMATGGRILHHLKHYASSYRNLILFTGYQAGGTRGARIIHGAKTVRIHGADIPIEAQVEYLTNTSAHADYDEMLNWLGALTNAPKQIIITHGEVDAAKSLKEIIESEFEYSCSIPQYLDVMSL